MAMAPNSQRHLPARSSVIQHHTRITSVTRHQSGIATLFMAAVGILTGMAPAMAQSSSAVDGKSGTIVVVGRDKAERDRQIRNFVQQMTPSKNGDPLARFDNAGLCPHVVGLSPASNRSIVTRLRRVATAIGIRTAGPDCGNADLLVIFADDKSAVVDLLRKRDPTLFRTILGDPIKIDMKPGPAVSWHVRGLISRDGMPVVQANGRPITTKTIAPPSRIQASVKPVFLMSVVVIEYRGAEGLTVMQVADYAAMRAFTDSDSIALKDGGTPTILTVLDAPIGSPTPLSLTSWDMSFLQGLYAVQPHSFAGSQRNNIERQMKQDLPAADPRP
jgi:hypothetical protein